MSVLDKIFRLNSRKITWRVGHHGRDNVYYEELRNGSWRSIEIKGRMLQGSPRHIIYFASPEEWQELPEWARNRRDEIIKRVKSAFRPPDYEYGETKDYEE